MSARYGMHIVCIRTLQGHYIWICIRALQIGARGITNRGNFKDFNSGQKDYKSRQGFQIGLKRFQIGAEITNRGNRDFKSRQGLQIGAEQGL